MTKESKTIRRINLGPFKAREIVLVMVACLFFSGAMVTFSWNRLYDPDTGITVDVGKKEFNAQEMEIINRYGRIIDGKYVGNDIAGKQLGAALFIGVAFVWIYSFALFIWLCVSKVEIKDGADKKQEMLERMAKAEIYIQGMPPLQRILVRLGIQSPSIWFLLFMAILLLVGIFLW